MAVALGKRYKDADSEIEVLCIKPGECNLNVDGRGMEELQAEGAALRRLAPAGLVSVARPGAPASGFDACTDRALP